jgi:hypothetical protein
VITVAPVDWSHRRDRTRTNSYDPLNDIMTLDQARCNSNYESSPSKLVTPTSSEHAIRQHCFPLFSLLRFFTSAHPHNSSNIPGQGADLLDNLGSPCYPGT